MRILISNDDGVTAPGINALASALSTIAEITVIAPDRNRSGASNSLTLYRPLRTTVMENGYISMNGTPTDCVHVGITEILEHKPDLVVSGINEGENLSDDVRYSGTVAAATEGRCLGFPAIAVSLAGKKCVHYNTAAAVAVQLVKHYIANPASFNMLLNVNVPDIPLHELQGLQLTHLGKRHIAEPTISSIDPRGNKIYWIGLPGPEAHAGPGTDFYAVNTNYVSITPLHVDLTYYKSFAQISSWVQDLSF